MLHTICASSYSFPPGNTLNPNMILVIDNYDSFTWNLVQMLGQIDSSLDIRVFRNDRITIDQIDSLAPHHLIISPGPCTPTEAGISVDCVKYFQGRLPILGVCLGHQSIGQATGAEIVSAKKLMHGKTDQIYHDQSGIFIGLPTPMTATRYHSLVIKRESLSADYTINAWTDAHDSDGEVMGIAHKTLHTFGVQFHPESFLTEYGSRLLENFIGY